MEDEMIASNQSPAVRANRLEKCKINMINQSGTFGKTDNKALRHDYTFKYISTILRFGNHFRAQKSFNLSAIGKMLCQNHGYVS